MSIETRELSTITEVGEGPSARSVSYIPSPYLSSTNVQAAIDALSADFGLAQAFAESAQASATSASNSAAASLASASSASTSATNAANSASSASTQATNAANSASSASTSATNAANSETAAQGYATSAAASESSASGYASAAAASAASAASYAAGWVGTSATSVTIGTGSKSFTASTGKIWAAGTPIIISSNAAPSNYMHGLVTSYNSGSGALVVNILNVAGSGAHSDWDISLSGPAAPGGGGDTISPAANNADYIPQWNGANSKTLKNGIDPSTLLTTTAAAAAYQPLDTDLTAIAALTTASYGRSLLAITSAANLAAEVDPYFLTPSEGDAAYQPLDGDLTSIAALSTTSYGRGLLTLANQTALIAEAKGWSPSAADKFVYSTGAGTSTEGSITAAGRALIDDADAAAQRTTLGLGSIATFAEGTAAEYRQNTSGKALSTDKVWTAASTHETMSDGATVTPDFNYFDHDWTIAGTGRTLANPTNIKAGQKGTIYITQDGTGSRTITSWGTYYKFINGNKPTLTTTAGAIDRISYDVKSSTEIHCFFAANMG